MYVAAAVVPRVALVVVEEVVFNNGDGFDGDDGDDDDGGDGPAADDDDGGDPVDIDFTL